MVCVNVPLVSWKILPPPSAYGVPPEEFLPSPLELHFTVGTVSLTVLPCHCTTALWHHVLSQPLCPSDMKALFTISVEKYIVKFNT